MPRAGSPLDLDWRRISRWCLLGTIVMVIWLMVPVAKCSFASFRDTPLNDTEEAGGASPGQADKNRVKAGESFVGTWWEQTVWCYDRTPLLGQEDWKTYLLLALAGATVATQLVGRIVNRRHGI